MLRRKGSKMDNRGSTLIEIIVSVLIIGIVFVPLLMGLTSAIKTNDRAEKKLNAESAGVNCMETVKAYGKSGLNNAAPTPNVEYGFTDLGSNAKIIKESDNSYKIIKIDEGTNTYYAKISFSDDNYKTEPITSGEPTPSVTAGPKQNDILYTQFTSITGDGTRPEKISVTKKMDDDLLKSLKDDSAEGALSDPEHRTKVPDGTSMRSLVKTKQTVIIVGQFPTDKNAADYNEDYPGRYYVKVGINYILDNKDSTTHKYYFDTNGDTYSYSSPLATQICQSDASGGPNALLLFYSTVNTISPASAVKLNAGEPTELIVLKKLCAGDINLYTFIAGADVTSSSDYSNDYMYFHVENETTDDINIYCSTNMEKHSLTTTEQELLNLKGLYNSTADTDFAKLDSITEEKKGKQMYDVTIELYDSNDVLSATKTSTIIE